MKAQAKNAAGVYKSMCGYVAACVVFLSFTLVCGGPAVSAAMPLPDNAGQPVLADEASLPIDPAKSGLRSLDARLAKAGLARGQPVVLRVFKEDSELELWMQSDGRFKHFATYKICRWRGVLGPKLTEGDRQSPEGFYSFSQDQLRWQGHWFRAFSLNYPNALDRALGRTGSGILIHGACSSIGCYAMTDPVIDEMFDLIVAAFAAGQQRVQVHIYPFHMTLANLARHEKSEWTPFWQDLKPASDLFITTRILPQVSMCEGRYVVRPGHPGQTADDRITDGCADTARADSLDFLTSQLDGRRITMLSPVQVRTLKRPSERVQLYAKLLSEGKIPKPQALPSQPSSYGPSPDVTGGNPAAPVVEALVALPERERAALLGVRKPRPAASIASVGEGGGGDSGFSCSAALAACRHFMAMHAKGPVAVRASKTKLAKK